MSMRKLGTAAILSGMEIANTAGTVEGAGSIQYGKRFALYLLINYFY